MWFALGVLGHLHQTEHFLDPLLDLGLRQTVLLETEGDVLLNGHVREQGIRLEHHVDRPLVRRHVGDVLAIEEDAPFGGSLEARQHAQQGRLARAGTAQQREDLALMNAQRDVIDRHRFVELLGDAIDLQQHLLVLALATEGLLVGAGGNGHARTPEMKKVGRPEPGYL